MQADTLTVASIGCHPLPIITAITVQNTHGVEGILPIDCTWVTDQARVILDDVSVAAFKIGVIGSLKNIESIAKIITDYPDTPVILDPVLSSARGDDFIDQDMIHAIKALLIPLCTVITPNTLELRRLTPENDTNASSEQLAIHLASGTKYVLVTGTHDPTPDVVHTLYNRLGIIRQDSWRRLPGSYHGSGCTLASAIAASIAKGTEIIDAVYDAQKYTWQTLVHGFRPSMGQYIPNRLF